MPDLLERLSAALGDRYAIQSEVGRGGIDLPPRVLPQIKLVRRQVLGPAARAV
jgi:hypothetical protein